MREGTPSPELLMGLLADPAKTVHLFCFYLVFTPPSIPGGNESPKTAISSIIDHVCTEMASSYIIFHHTGESERRKKNTRRD